MKSSPQANRPKPKARPQSKGQTWIGGFRRLSKKDREKIYRRFTLIFLVLFLISIAGGLVIATVRPAANH